MAFPSLTIYGTIPNLLRCVQNVFDQYHPSPWSFSNISMPFYSAIVFIGGLPLNSDIIILFSLFS